MASPKDPGAAERVVDETMTDLSVGMVALRQWFSRQSRLLPERLRWRFIGRPIGTAMSTALTVAIPLMAVNAQVAFNTFPDPLTDLSLAGRQPNILILAKDGTELGSRGSDLGDPVDIDTLPPYVVEAFLATEDRNFFEHPGFDPFALLRATLRNWTAGTVVQGGSTITQQLAKNLFLTGDQTIERKFEELHLSLWLEARLTKKEILELYLNRIYLGANTFGLSAASQAYFSKPAEELTLSEAALLAGLPKAPSTLAPLVILDGAIKRSHEVIGNLLETQKITGLTARLAMMEPPTLALRDERDGYGYFLDHVAAELALRAGDANTDLVVTTTLDPVAQRHAEAAVKAVVETDAAKARGATQAALIAYDRRGGIAAMVGGQSYRLSQFNRTTQAKRQPGSAFKPFVYLAAMEAGFDQDTVLVDQPVQVDGWSPKNYRETFLGAHRLREAFARSSNTATVQISEAIGRERIIDAAQQVGINALLEPYPTLPLGVFETSLHDLTAAYMPFAYEGHSPKPHAIASISTRGGQMLYERQIDVAPRVISVRSAEKMTDLLLAVTTSGTGRSARIPGHEVAGKTGTTDDWRDAWFIGYSAHLTAGVWVGNDDSEPMDRVSGATFPAQIWSNFMGQTHVEEDLEPLSLDHGYFAPDKELYSLKSTYDALRDDLMLRAYGAREYSTRRNDSIGGILRRQMDQGPYVPESPVQGRVVRPREDRDSGTNN